MDQGSLIKASKLGYCAVGYGRASKLVFLVFKQLRAFTLNPTLLYRANRNLKFILFMQGYCVFGYGTICLSQNASLVYRFFYLCLSGSNLAIFNLELRFSLYWNFLIASFSVAFAARLQIFKPGFEEILDP